jgi:ParB-like chromosome segregation protein Spo0J
MSGVVSQRFVRAHPIDALIPFKGNPNRGRSDLIEQSIDQVGFYGAVLAQEGSGVILAGHHRVEAARAKGITKLPVIFVDVDDDAARRIIVGDNRIGRVGSDDDDDLLAILSSLAASDSG